MGNPKIAAFASVVAMALTLVFGFGVASATTLEEFGTAKNQSVTIEATLASGTSALLKDEFGTTTDTCTTSQVSGSTEGTFTGSTVGGFIWSTSGGNCSHTTTILSGGKFSIGWTSGTNGTVKSSEFELTVLSTFFGASAVCKTGSGTSLGTLTGVSSGNATVDVNAKVNCGILGNATFTGTYSVTRPFGLGVVS